MHNAGQILVKRIVKLTKKRCINKSGEGFKCLVFSPASLCFTCFWLNKLACPARFERATYALEGRCSIQLSYGQMDFLDFNGMLEPWEFGIGL